MSDPAVDLGDSWKPASLREAEAALDETMAKSREVIEQAEEKLKHLPDIDHTAKPEDIAAVKAAAERPDAPAALRAMKKKVDAGELTWKDILEGKALQDDTVRGMMSARLDEMREIYQEAEAGASLEEILEARGVTSGSVFDDGGAGAARTYSQAAPPSPPSEDDYFAGGHMVSDDKRDDTGAARTPPPPPTPPSPPSPPQPPRRTPPPARRDEEYDEDDFADPLASRGGEHQQPRDTGNTPRDTGNTPGGTRNTPRRGRRDEPDDDDYFGGSVLN
ncbi:hypothetical protein [Amycolatopsis pigmentata]|uniref:Uncharacterized protein n=1 Tax=Amycolatopsis pigmentata TaxID=450801 RepID=A0ABW5FUJ5_9PSEU